MGGALMSQFGFLDLMVAVLVPAMVCASWNDYRFHRVPNWLNAVIAVTGLAAQASWLGWPGVQAGLLGVLVGFAPLFVLWAMRGMGAGDVKFMAAIGAWLGPEMTFHAVVAGGLMGGLIAVGMIAWRRSWRQTSTNLGLLLTKVGTLRTAFSEYGSTRQLSASAAVLPYAIPLSIGTLFVLVSNYSGWWEVL
ncbi:MAG: prepilin peptidase [Phycisphaerae bacterium]